MYNKIIMIKIIAFGFAIMDFIQIIIMDKLNADNVIQLVRNVLIVLILDV